jgi:hypothetical protein
MEQMEIQEHRTNENSKEKVITIDYIQKLIEAHEKRKEVNRQYMQRQRTQKRDEVNAYKREHYRLKREGEKKLNDVSIQN